MPVSLIFLALTSALAVFAGQRPTSRRAVNLPTGKIIGVVLDANNARIAGATIKIWNGRFNRQAQSGEEGDFELELPVGLYRITVEQPGFRRFELSSFRVVANVNKMLKVRMKVKEPEGLQPASITSQEKGDEVSFRVGAHHSRAQTGGAALYSLAGRFRR